MIVFSIIFIPLAISSSSQKHSAGTTPSDAGTSPADDFNRTDGSLGPSWTNMSDAKMAISSHAVTGTSISGVSGDIWTAHAVTSDQYSQVEVASTQLTGTQWIGPAVRVADGGQNAYLGIYWWNSGRPELKLYLRHAGNFIPVGSVYNSGPLAAGTKLKLVAVGNTISFMENGVQRISVADSTLSQGAAGHRGLRHRESR